MGMLLKELADNDRARSEQPPQDSPDPLAAARARRLLALQAAEGLWKDRTDVPKDGVAAQEQLRDEWH